MDQVDRILAQWRQQRPDLDVAAMGTLGRLARLARHIAAELEQVFAAHGLTAASFDVLATLRRSAPPHALSPSALMGWTMVTSGTMTNRLDRLEAEGLIVRQANPQDGRGQIVALTAQGLARIDAAVADHVATQQRLMAALPHEARARLDGDLRLWLAVFEGGGAGARPDGAIVPADPD